MLDSLKKMTPLPVKQVLKGMVSRESIKLPPQARVFIFLAADYGNIGDLAITAAQAKFLDEHADDRSVIRVPISRTRALIGSIRKQVRPDDLVTIIGGGNMGVLYPDIEQLRQLVIRSFPENRIVCFPQSLDWLQSHTSDNALARIRRKYSRHPDLHVFAREAVSRDKLESLFADHGNVHVGYVPDIVLSVDAAKLGLNSLPEPSGVLLCMRDDRERSVEPDRLLQLHTALKRTGLEVTLTDTHAGGSKLNDERCAELLVNKVSQFAGAQLVVTDRLHGMILSLVAGTPCLALPNANHKIRQTWQDWLTGLPQVQFVEPEQLSKLPDIVAKLLTTPRRNLTRPPLELNYYDSLIEAIAAP